MVPESPRTDANGEIEARVQVLREHAEWLRSQPRCITSTLSEEAWKARQNGGSGT